MEIRIRLFALFIIFSQLITTASKYLEGTLSTVEKWSFLARFCFLSDMGKLHYVFTFPPEFQPQSLLLYYDGPDQWSAVYKKGLSCVAMTSPPHINPENNQEIKLDVSEPWSGCQPIIDNVTKTHVVRCEATRSFLSARERWWFLAMARCQNTTIPGLFIKYQIHMTNGAGGDIFHEEFSADEFSILEVDIAFLLVMVVILIFAIISADQLQKKLLFHTTYKMYLVSLSLECFYIFIMCIAYGKYANDGKDQTGLKTFGRVAGAASFLVFILLLLLIGKGFTITRGRISTSGSIKIAVFMTLYTLTYAILFIYEAAFFDPGDVLYIYESPPGYGLLVMQLVAWIYFSYACFFTVKHYPEKSKFYTPFYIFYSIWFLIGPIFVIIAYFGFPKYQRAKIVNGIDLGITFLAQAYLLFLTRPQNSNKNFPFHVRTSQIGILRAEKKDDDNYTPHPYAPTQEFLSPGPDFTTLFTVTKAVYTLLTLQCKNFTQFDGVCSKIYWLECWTDNSKPDHQEISSARSQNAGTSGSQAEQNGTIDKFPHAVNGSPFVTQH